MKHSHRIPSLLLLVVICVHDLRATCSSVNTSVGSVENIDVGTGRVLFPWYFPWLPQFRGIDLGERFNSIRAPEDTGYFMTRDTIAFFITNIGWMILHALLWRGKVTRSSELGFPFNIVALIFGSPSNEGKNPDDRLFLQSSVEELDGNALINFFLNPMAATRNLYLSGGFSFFALVLWLLPTFLWTGTPLPTNSDKKRESRFINIVKHVRSGSNAVGIYNRLMCPQCILVVMAINLVALMSRYIFWSVLSASPDLPSFGVPKTNGRSLNSERESSSFRDILNEAIDDFLLSVDLRMDTIVKDLEKREVKHF